MNTSNQLRPTPIFTTSWDDGHPLDVRLAELLESLGFQATFFVPLSNREGLPVMTGNQVRGLLTRGFEIGSHTIDHCYLTSVDDITARNQIVKGKKQLEQLLGESVRGFCYPGGKFTTKHREMVRSAGFGYARTTKNFYLDTLPDAYSMPVGLQCYPHSAAVLVRNFIRNGAWRQRGRMFSLSIFRRDFLNQMKATLDAVCLQGGVFHLWGHSWELDKFGGWELLEEFLRYASLKIPAQDRLTNIDVLRRKLVLP